MSAEPFIILQDTAEPSAEHDAPEALFIPRVYRHADKGRPGEYVAAPTRRIKLETADYSLPGLETVVAIERKTCPDLIKTLLGGHRDSVGEYVAEAKRFRAELERMRDMAPGSLRAVIVEASVDDIERELFKVPKGREHADEIMRAQLDRRYAGTFAEGAIKCEACPAYRWPGERCHLCAEHPPGEVYFEGVNPVSLLHFCDSLSLDYCVPWIWAGSKESAERWVGGTLRRVWEQAAGKGEAFKKAIDRGVAGHRPWLAQHTGEVIPSGPRVAEAGGMPLSTSAAQLARERARAHR